MTLIAATRLEGVPVLIGDLLRTKEAPPGTSSYHPVQPFAAAGLPRIRRLAVSDAARKVLLINDRLAIGWTGSSFGAQSILKRVRTTFSKKLTTWSELEAFLSHENRFQSDKLSFWLIGWISDGEHRCFLWNSQWPTELFSDDEYFGGGGEELFKAILENATFRHIGPGLTDPVEIVQASAATQMCKCIAEDALSGKLTEAAFGYAFETIFWNGAAFQYLEEVTYFTRLEIVKLPGGRFRSDAPRLCVKYKSFRDYCVVQTVHLSGLFKDSVIIEMVAAPGDIPDDRRFQAQLPFPLKSPLYSLFASVKVPGGETATGPVTIADGDEKFFRLSESKRQVYMRTSIEKIYWQLAVAIPGFILRSPDRQ